MIEFLRHALGLCGEPHPSLLNFLIATPVLGYLIIRIKYILKKKIMKKTICKLLCTITFNTICLGWCGCENKDCCR
jgi:D-alanyl-lipoteichoic acid acyltransferase DltB (MBOAT superfamily)